ncbi:unnamed protein product [Linum tenue]|uniref:Protein gar2 n=1 Tax=Linum tenue TaxID=586396 RepID=A0AAV0M9X1_9ROSI|nr:unnamed protein product [Linum tenue]
MVLSNKKLKQKLREAKAESLASSISGESVSNANGDAGAILGLQERLDAAKQKTRLAKKDKRKNSQGLENDEGKGPASVKKEVMENGDEKKGEGKKRKREEGKSGEKKDGKQAKMKKKKDKNKNKKIKAAENGEEDKQSAVSGGGVAEVEMKRVVESSVKLDTATKVYVGGIPYYSTEDDIRSFFDSCGTITEIDCMKFPDSGKFRGIAIINFKTDAAAKRALDLDGADMGGFFLKVRPYKATTRQTKVPDFVPQIVKGYNRIYVGNLPWDITEENLRKFFSDCTISSIRFGMDKETGEFRGYGHVDFSDDVSMMMALKMDQQILCGRPVKISCAVPRKAGEARPKDGPRPSRNDEVSNPEVIPTPPVAETTAASIEASYYEIPTTSIVEVVRNEASSEAPAPVSGKIKRRTCYECGQKGHISTACPNKPDVPNPITD